LGEKGREKRRTVLIGVVELVVGQVATGTDAVMRRGRGEVRREDKGRIVGQKRSASACCFSPT
jgi:hypothetical protein